MLFIIPLICNEKNPLFLLNKNLDIFNSDTNKPQWEDKIILCYKNGGNFNEVQNYLRNHPLFYAKYTEQIDDYYTIYAFIIPKEFKKDYFYLLNGEYTKISNQARLKIKGTWNFSATISETISSVLMGLHSKVKHHPPLYDVLNLNQVPTIKA